MWGDAVIHLCHVVKLEDGTLRISCILDKKPKCILPMPKIEPGFFSWMASTLTTVITLLSYRPLGKMKLKKIRKYRRGCES